MHVCGPQLVPTGADAGTATATSCWTTCSSTGGPTTPGRRTGSPRPHSAVSRRGDPTLGRGRDHRELPDAGRHLHQPAAALGPGRPGEGQGAARVGRQDPGAGCCDLCAARHLTGARRCRRAPVRWPRGSGGARDRRRPVRRAGVRPGPRPRSTAMGGVHCAGRAGSLVGLISSDWETSRCRAGLCRPGRTATLGGLMP